MLQRGSNGRRPAAGLENPIFSRDFYVEGQDVRQLLAVLKQSRRRMVVMAIVGAVVALIGGGLYVTLRTQTYTASANLLIYNTTMQMSGPDAVVTQVMVENTLVQDDIELAKSSRVINLAIDAVGAAVVAEMLPQPEHISSLVSQFLADRNLRAGTPIDERQALVIKVRAALKVARVGASQIISIGVRSATAQGAVTLANALASALVKDETDASALITTSALLREKVSALGPMVRIVDDAIPPRQKDGPGTLIVLLSAVLGGAAAGAVAAATISIFSRRIRCPEQFAGTSAADFLGFVPSFKRSSQSDDWATLLSSPGDELRHSRPAGEQTKLDVLGDIIKRTRRAVLEDSTAKPHIVGITACNRGDGATFLAVSFAAQLAAGERRTLFIDADSDHPDVSESLGGEAAIGLHQVLAEPELVDRAVIKLDRGNLDVLPIGRWRDDSDEGWGELAANVQATALQNYDWIVVGLPPLRSSGDVRSACHFVDHLLVVTQWGQTSVAHLQEGLAGLSSNIVKHRGTFINRANSTAELASLLPSSRGPAAALRAQRRAVPAMRFGRILIGLATFAAIMLCGVTSSRADYRLGVSDKVRLKVQEYPDISGGYTVDTEGMLSIPLIGNVNAAGMTVKDVANSIESRLQARSGAAGRPLAAIEVVEFRPIYVLGDVQKPGEYPFRPGMTVVQAISVAGGYYRPADPGLMRVGRDVVLAEGDIATYSSKRLRQLARAARLSAERDNKSTIDFPAELTAQANGSARAESANEIINDERAAFDENRSQGERDARYLKSVEDLYHQEIISLRGQIEDLKKESAIIQDQLDSLKALSGKGLALRPTQTMLDRMSAQISNEQLGLNTAVVKAEEEIESARRQVAERADERKQKIISDTLETKTQIAELDSKIATARELKDEAQFQAPHAAEEIASVRDKHGTVVVLRASGQGAITLADETTILNAGDVVKVAPPKRDFTSDLSADQRSAARSRFSVADPSN
jgi:polysaccharide biosynthesis/export protein ExoF